MTEIVRLNKKKNTKQNSGARLGISGTNSQEHLSVRGVSFQRKALILLREIS